MPGWYTVNKSVKKVGFNTVNFQNYPDSGIKGGPWVPEWMPFHLINVHLNFSMPITWFPIKVSHWDGENSHSALLWSTDQVCWEKAKSFQKQIFLQASSVGPLARRSWPEATYDLKGEECILVSVREIQRESSHEWSLHSTQEP